MLTERKVKKLCAKDKDQEAQAAERPAHHDGQGSIFNDEATDVEPIREERSDEEYHRHNPHEQPQRHAQNREQKLNQKVIELLPIKPAMWGAVANLHAQPPCAAAGDGGHEGRNERNPGQHDNGNHSSGNAQQR